MTQPFSYLKAEAPPLKSGFRKPEEIYGTGLQQVSYREETEQQELVNEAYRVENQRAQNSYLPTPPLETMVNTQQQQQQQQLQQQQQQQQPEVNHLRQIRGVEYTSAFPYNKMNQEEVNEIRQLKQTSKSNGKKPPEVALKYSRDQRQFVRPDDNISDLKTDHINLPQQGRDNNLYGPRQHERPPGEKTNLDPMDEHLYGRVTKRNHDYESDSKTPHRPVANANNLSLFPPTVEPSTGSASHNERDFTRSELTDRTKDYDLFPPSSNVTQNPSIFENFILVGPGKNEPRKEDRELEKEPKKRLKLEELFDPPPPAHPLPKTTQDPRKVSIFGVTNTESSDYPNGSANNSRSKTSGNGKAPKGPVSTFDNPDYAVSSNYPAGYSPQGFREDRSWSVRTATSNATATGISGSVEKSRAIVSQRGSRTGDRCDRRLCTAILITAFVTAVICLGVGFIAGWFGRSTVKPN